MLDFRKCEKSQTFISHTALAPLAARIREPPRELLKEGGWLKRCSLGWLPAAYLRLMPAFYRGVDPVIDHDRGTMPGVAGHSTVKPLLPPVMWTEKIDPKELNEELERAGRLPGGAAPASSR